MKKCNKCGKELPEDCFSKDKSKKDGLRTICKDCTHKTSKKYREQNQEKIREAKKSYAEKNKDKIRSYKRQYREQNKDTISK